MVEIVTIRLGVQFTPDAAAAFLRAEARVWQEFGRGIDVNSTWRSRSRQLAMYNAWQAYIKGRGPHPGHSKALHPDDPLAFHTKGEALDSDDWVNAQIVQILAENGFIRNRLYVPNEQHHFEYLAAQDKNRNAPTGGGSLIPINHREEPDMATGVIYTDDKADKTRSGAVLNTESGAFSEFGWFPKTYANQLAVGFGLSKAGQVTRGHFDQLRKDMADLRAQRKS